MPTRVRDGLPGDVLCIPRMGGFVEFQIDDLDRPKVLWEEEKKQREITPHSAARISEVKINSILILRTVISSGVDDAVASNTHAAHNMARRMTSG